jgi:hypothetical protein
MIHPSRAYSRDPTTSRARCAFGIPAAARLCLPEGDDYLHVHLNLAPAALARARYAGKRDRCVARLDESFDVRLVARPTPAP